MRRRSRRSRSHGIVILTVPVGVPQTDATSRPQNCLTRFRRDHTPASERKCSRFLPGESLSCLLRTLARMSMIGEYLRVTPAELDRAIQDPAWALEFGRGDPRRPGETGRLRAKAAISAPIRLGICSGSSCAVQDSPSTSSMAKRHSRFANQHDLARPCLHHNWAARTRPKPDQSVDPSLCRGPGPGGCSALCAAV
jgi:hypothetical protein